MTRILITTVMMIGVIAITISFAQMPDWVGIKDKDGNRYFFDQTGKVRTLGEPLKKYISVSAQGIEYYINHGEELIKYHHKLEGLIILKSILAMPAESSMVMQAQQKASKIINSLAMRDGTRFAKLLREASLLMYRNGNSTTILDDHMRFSLTVNGLVEVIRKKMKSAGAYEYQGVLLGLQFHNKNDALSTYDAIMAIDAEKYTSNCESVNEIERHWELAAGKADITRTVITKSDKKAVSEFSMTGKVPLRGVEGFYISGKRGYFIKIVSPADRYDSLRGKILAAADSFHVVSP